MPIEKAVLLVNLGTPDAPTSKKVRTYLNEFLSDPRVIDINAVGRWLLLHLFILPFRPKKSAALYRKIWSSAGSPLLEHTRLLTEKLKARMPAHIEIDFVMRYGNPSIDSVIAKLMAQSPQELVVMPLYPQYASSSTGSTLEAIYKILSKKWNVPAIRTVVPFYRHPQFLDAIIAIGRPLLQSFQPDFILFTYHGLPERQIRKSECTPDFCLKADNSCCASITNKNGYCYRAQCFETTRQLADRLALSPNQYSTAFQSRLGRTPWIKPYADVVIEELAKQGKKKVLVFSPSFVADCLETLEEISIRGQKTFTDAGGEKLLLVPSLNSSEAWANAVEKILFPA